MKCFITKTGCFIAFGLFFSLHAFAQNAYYQHHITTENGSWRLFTDYTSRSTIVKFYNASHQVIYEEIIPGKYIKLNKKNVRQLNQTLTLLSGNQLIASTVKSIDLLAEQRPSLVDIPTALLRDELKTNRALNSASGFRINADLLINAGKVNIIFENLRKNTIKIQLLDETGRTVYRDQTTLAGYSRTLNLRGMEPGKYRLHIKGEGIDFKRKIVLSYKNNHPHLQTIVKDAASTAMQIHSL